MTAVQCSTPKIFCCSILNQPESIPKCNTCRISNVCVACQGEKNIPLCYACRGIHYHFHRMLDWNRAMIYLPIHVSARVPWATAPIIRLETEGYVYHLSLSVCNNKGGLVVHATAVLDDVLTEMTGGIFFSVIECPMQPQRYTTTPSSGLARS